MPIIIVHISRCGCDMYDKEYLYFFGAYSSEEKLIKDVATRFKLTEPVNTLVELNEIIGKLCRTKDGEDVKVLTETVDIDKSYW